MAIIRSKKFKSKFEGKKVKPNDTEKIIYLEKSKFHAIGDISEVHPVQAEKLIAFGKAAKWTPELEERLAKETGEEEDVKPKSKGKETPKENKEPEL
jgi:hypothetical protein